MSELVLETRGLVKRYPSVTAVDHLDLCVGRGELVGLIGPNGAGKTTTFRILVGLLKADEGEAFIDGHSVEREPLMARAAVGYVPQHIQLFNYLTAHESLHFIADLRSIPADIRKQRMSELYELLELGPHKERLVREFSGGMKRKLAIATALLARPPLLLFDESFVGLDPESTYRLRAYLDRYVSDGGTLLLSSHILDMVERMVNRVIIVHQGKLVAELDNSQIQELSASDTTLTERYLKETDNSHLLSDCKVNSPKI